MRGGMRRIALILLLFILLSQPPIGRSGNGALAPVALSVRAEAVPVDAAVMQRDYGGLRLTGLWSLHGSIGAFGGISALLADADGRFIAITDSGESAMFKPGGAGRMAALPRLASDGDTIRGNHDSESVTRDPVTGRIWIGFERAQRICRYAPELAQIERCASAAALQAWPIEGSIEALARLGDGRFIAISERANTPSGGYDALLWAGDPVEPSTAPPVHLTYRGPPGYRPTDALWLGGDRLLVLTRRLTLLEGFTARLTLVRLPKLEAGATLHGETIAAFRSPGPSDNLEALALGEEGGRPVLYIAADDNRLFFQRSLLFRFALPDGWVSDAPAP
jgi:hypothetical protein